LKEYYPPLENEINISKEKIIGQSNYSIYSCDIKDIGYVAVKEIKLKNNEDGFNNKKIYLEKLQF